MIRRLADRVRAGLALLGPLGAGSRVFLLRLVGRFGWKVVGAGLLAAVYVAVRFRTWIVWMLLAWAVAAWMHAPGTPDEQREQAGEEPPADPLVAILWHLIGDAPGTHLKTVTERLQKAAPEEDIDRAAVRAKLAARGIPVKPSVRDAAGRVNEGVHRADLQAWQAASSPPAVAPVPEARSKPVATPLTCDVADAATAVATPLTPAE
jgi:hypothetical protein